MIEIPEPPDVTVCGSCMRALRWMYSYATGQTFAAVVDPERRDRFELHRCQPLQSPVTWRRLDHGDPPSAAYLAAKQALKSKERTDEGDAR